MSIQNIFNTQISTNMKEGILFHYLQGICKKTFKAIYSIQFKIICIALFTIQSLQSSFTGN